MNSRQVIMVGQLVMAPLPSNTKKSKRPNSQQPITSDLLSAVDLRRPKQVRSVQIWLSRRREQSVLTWILALSLFRSAQGQCPVHTMTSFERISGVTVNSNLLQVLYTAPNVTQPISLHHLLSGAGGSGGHSQQTVSMTIPITAECNNRCRRSARCRAFLVDYARHTCYSIDSSISGGGANANQLIRNPTPIQLLPTQDRTSYFEKICLNLPAIDCERAWIFERVLSYHLHGHDDKIIEDVPSRLRCQEHCLNERDFKCRSGEYDFLTQQCRLSMLDRHVKPNSFRLSAPSVDYFENQCVPVGNQCDAFDRFEDLDLGRAEIMRSANTSDQCQLFCTQTIKAFVCRSFTWNPITGKCYLNSANTFTVGGLDKLISAPGLIYYQRNDCIDLKLECDTSAMTLQLRTNEPFRGRMYVRDEPNLCESLGRSALSSSLSIPFNHNGAGGLTGAGRSCATRELPSRYSSVVVVQEHPLIQRKSDRYIKLVCDFQTANKTISSSYNVVANPWTSTALINATSFAPKIRLRITDRIGNDITGAKLGDELYLRIEAETESVYDMVARSVLAKSGTSEESIALIDKDGCPTDFRIFPPLKKLNRRTIMGKFDAFKFSSDVVVRFQVDVQFCLNQCPPANCDHIQQLQLQQQQQQQLMNAPAQLPSPADVSGVENYSAVSLRPTTTSSPLPEVPTTRPTMTAAAASSTTQSNSQSPESSLLQQANQEAAPSSGSSYHLLESGLRTPANVLGSGQFYAEQSSNGHQHSPASGEPSSLSNYPIGVNQLQTLMGSALSGESPQSVTSDPQTFESGQARAKSDSAQPNLAGGMKRAHQSHQGHQSHQNHQNQPSQPNQQQQQRRRRRSAEPMPQAPRHVPLQREIIVESSGSANINKAATSDQRQSKSASSQEGRRTKTSKMSGGIEFVGSPGSRSNSLVRNGPAYDTSASSGSNKPDNDTDGRMEEDNNDNGTLLCTTRQSLVLGSLAFCILQLLSFVLCFVTWLHKRDGKFKVSQKHQQQVQQVHQVQQRHRHQQQQYGQRFY